MKITNRSIPTTVELKTIRPGELFRTNELKFIESQKGDLMLKTTTQVHPDLDYDDDDQEIMCVSLPFGNVHNISNSTEVTKVESELIITEA